MENNDMINRKYILFEGIDCQGKTTQEQKLQKWIQDRVGTDNVHLFQEKSFSNKYWEIIKDSRTDKVEEFFLFLSQRRYAMMNETDKLLKDGKFVIQDRQMDSTMVYQYFNSEDIQKQIPMSMQSKLNFLQMNNTLPVLTFYLTVDFDEFVERFTLKNPDKLDNFQFNKFHDIINRYEMLYQNQQYLTGRKVKKINTSNKEPLEVFEIIKDTINENDNLII